MKVLTYNARKYIFYLIINEKRLENFRKVILLVIGLHVFFQISGFGFLWINNQNWNSCIIW